MGRWVWLPAWITRIKNGKKNGCSSWKHKTVLQLSFALQSWKQSCFIIITFSLNIKYFNKILIMKLCSCQGFTCGTEIWQRKSLKTVFLGFFRLRHSFSLSSHRVMTHQVHSISHMWHSRSKIHGELRPGREFQNPLVISINLVGPVWYNRRSLCPGEVAHAPNTSSPMYHYNPQALLPNERSHH